MKDQSFDSIARRAGSARDRRTSLKLLAAGALATAATAPMTAEAGKAGKKARKKCKKQGGPCRDFATDMCEALLPPAEVEECIELFQPCCGSIQKCKGPAFFDCVEERLLTILTTT